MGLTVTVTGSPVEGATLVAVASGPVPPPTPGQRFPSNIDWRFVVLDRKTWKVLTFLDRIAFNRSVYYELNQAAYAAGDVSSDNPEVKILHTDGDPFLSYNDRVLIGLRREGASSGGRPHYMTVPPLDGFPWVPRFAGLITQLQRQAQSDQPVSHYTAYDPLQYWASRPVVNDQGVLFGPDWIIHGNPRGSDVLIRCLTNAEAAQGPLYVDWGQVAGGAYYGGVIEDTSTFSQFPVPGSGASLADLVKNLTDSGTMDVVLTPIYDPLRPGILAELSIYNRAGSDRNEAIFAWDLPSRSLADVDLMHDGSAMANTGSAWLPKANTFLPIQTDTPTQSFYGQWWLLSQSFSSATIGSLATMAAYENLLLLAAIEQAKLGKTTLSISPVPERSPLPWQEYWLGDGVPVYASDDFGEQLDAGNADSGSWSRLQRVTAVPVTITDDGVEQIESMLVTYVNAPGPPQPPREVAITTSLATTQRVANYQTRTFLTYIHPKPPLAPAVTTMLTASVRQPTTRIRSFYG